MAKILLCLVGTMMAVGALQVWICKRAHPDRPWAKCLAPLLSLMLIFSIVSCSHLANRDTQNALTTCEATAKSDKLQFAKLIKQCRDERDSWRKVADECRVDQTEDRD